ncbi:superoxide dismutase family protein [Thalassobacillus devorans]|uniref:superoxide dismutase family protein n=1 Tax=Thalassobacillus devorans TaxID=279813 RepID=UPI000A1CA870|nr:superoxide dismutase family protein [Thalassobacillus devorans]
MKRWMLLAITVLMIAILAACGGNEESGENSGNEDTTEENNEEQNSEESQENEDGESKEEEGAETEEVTVDLKDPDDENIGTAKLKQQEDGVLISLDASGLPPDEHGFHIHETGTCEAPEFESAGGHFNPEGVSHGTNSEDGPHAGDLPNIDVGDDGSIQEEILAENVTMKKGEDNSLLKEEGTALVIHAKPDDNESQPSGDAGIRIACGEINDGLLE